MMAMFIASIFAVSAWAQDVKTDYTDAIKNASVAENAEWEGGLSHGNGGLYKTSAESFDFTQTITLPAGQYKMTAKAAYRYAGSNDGPTSEEYEYNQIQAGVETHLAKLYAQTSSYKYEANVQNRWEGASDTDYLSGGSSTVNGKFVPNSSNAVKAWFDNGKYVNELVFNVQEDGAVKIGIAKNAKAPNGDYTNIGAWTLTRLGDAEADPKEEVEGGEALVDCTDKVDQNGWVCENGKANNVTIDGIVMKENFQDGQTSTSASTTGVVLSQTVTGLENGKYNVELWANARVAWQESPATDGQEELTYLVANNVEISMKVFLNPQLNNNATYVLEDVLVTDGTMYIAMTKKAAGSNWHSIQIKSLTYNGAASEDDILNSKKEAFLARAAKFDEFINNKVDWNWLTINTTYLYDVQDGVLGNADYQIVGLVDRMDEVTDAAVLEDWTKKMDDVEALLTEVNAAAADYYYFLNFSMDLQSATMVDEDACREAWGVYEQYSSYGANAQSAADITAAANALKAAYVKFVSNAVPVEGVMFDVTCLIADAAVTSVDAWETNLEIKDIADYDGAPEKKALDGWRGGQEELYAKQIISNLPAGVYALTAWGRRNNESVEMAVYAIVGEEEYKANIPSEAWSEVVVEDISVSEGSMEIGMKGVTDVSWVGVDNFKLYYAGAVAEEEASYLPVVGAKVGDVDIVEGAATVESISTIDITFDRPVALVKGAWATILDPWGGASPQAEVLADNNCVVRFTVDEYFVPFEYVLNIPAGLIVDAATGLFANAEIEVVITIEGGSDTPSASLNVTSVTVGEDEMADFSAISATTKDKINVNFDGMFWYQGDPKIVDADGNNALEFFEFGGEESGTSYFFKGMKAGVYTITLAKDAFLEYAMMYKAPAEDIVLTVQIVENEGGEGGEGDEGGEEEVEVTLSLNTTQTELTAVGATFQLVATVTPADMTVTWSSSSDEVATVDANGLVTAVGDGMAQITATVGDKSVTCYVIVTIEAEENPDTKINSIDADANAVIYDLSGRRVEKAVKGIYIINGRKVVIK